MSRGVDRSVPGGRFEAFSDGVFAIAITLLVLELKVPEGSGPLLGALGELWPGYLGYLVSFVFIGNVWVSHSMLSKFLKSTDQILVGLNLLLLLLVTLLPFTTELMAVHLTDSGEHVAVVIFGLNLMLAAALLGLMIDHVRRTPGLSDPEAAEDLRDMAKDRRISLIFQAAATALGLILPFMAVLVYLLISVVALIQPLWKADRHRRAARSSA